MNISSSDDFIVRSTTGNSHWGFNLENIVVDDGAIGKPFIQFGHGG